MSLKPYLTRAHDMAGRAQSLFANREVLKPEMVKGYILSRNAQGVWLLIYLDEIVTRPETFRAGNAKGNNALHHFSTINEGRPAFLSNSNGLRVAMLLTDPPTLPETAIYPGHVAGFFTMGVDSQGRPVGVPWESLGHVMIAGMTGMNDGVRGDQVGGGKSNLLRGLLEQAVEDGHQVYLVDTQNKTAPHLASHPRVVLVKTFAQVPGVLDDLLHEYDRRVALLDPHMVEDVDMYNAQFPAQALPRIFVALEEYCGLVNNLGLSSKAYKALLDLIWQARKYGIHIIAAGQTFEKAVAGQVKDQMATKICFRMESASQTRIVLGRNGAENITQPGRCDTNRWGRMQAYRFPLRARPTEPGGPELSEDERNALARIQTEHEGKATLNVLQTVLDIGPSAAKRVQAEWARRQLIAKDPSDSNSFKLAFSGV